MRFEKRLRDGIDDGSITVAFRRWKRHQVVAGNRYRTGTGMVEMDAVDLVDLSAVTETDARRAGYASVRDLLADLPGAPDTPLYRLAFHKVPGPDPRDRLASDDAVLAGRMVAPTQALACSYHAGMTDSESRAATLIPVHIGAAAPIEEDFADAPALPSQRQRQSALVEPGGIAWHKHGVEPRWLGMETNDCAAALDPSIFRSRGADEWQRFLAGAVSRQETALVIATVGDAQDDSPRSILSRYDASVSLPDFRYSISGRRLPVGTRLVLPPN
jgi:hypothetical protein